MEALAPLWWDAGDQLEVRSVGVAAHGEEDADGPVGEASDRVGQDGGRAVVEPLRVVDREDEGRLRRRGSRSRLAVATDSVR